MYDFPMMRTMPQMPIIHSMSREACGARFPGVTVNSMASAVWPTSGKVIFVPFQLTEYKQPVKGFCVNGSANLASFDVGIYDPSCTIRLCSTGQVVQSGFSQAQLATLYLNYPTGTPRPLSPGLYYMALAMAATPQVYRLSITAAQIRRAGVLEKANGGLPLPATVTPVASTGTLLPHFGIIFDPRS